MMLIKQPHEGPFVPIASLVQEILLRSAVHCYLSITTRRQKESLICANREGVSLRLIPIVCLSALVFAQQSIPPGELDLTSTNYIPPSLFSVKTETRLVEVGIVVRDSGGHTIGGLARDDFEVEDGGHKRDLSAFTAETAAPRVPALVSAAPSA